MTMVLGPVRRRDRPKPPGEHEDQGETTEEPEATVESEEEIVPEVAPAAVAEAQPENEDMEAPAVDVPEGEPETPAADTASGAKTAKTVEG